MALAEDFEKAQVRAKAFSRMPSSEELLDLYSLYKQATVGDVQGKRPAMFDIKARAKYDAWTLRKAMSKDNAMKAYVSLVDKLAGRYA